ncbi:hypothetical protein [Corallococcus sp. AS-1-12]|uniref:hypothetical protein n=1 Tax=Corallococcus sp. AS-1-12 TaxID=2874598 RepID=UPI001CC0AEBF|nr:hypothetical protein [Corallococcus sp. AS-1-12]MBZ4334087.1 hypothetical protein [Corallococcus sp. AS-1-12]
MLTFDFDGDLRDVLSRFLEAAGVVGVMSPGVNGSVSVETPLLEIGAYLARDGEKYFLRAAAGFDAVVAFNFWVWKSPKCDPVEVFRLMLWGRLGFVRRLVVAVF